LILMYILLLNCAKGVSLPSLLPKSLEDIDQYAKLVYHIHKR
jgi:hypothetical protein